MKSSDKKTPRSSSPKVQSFIWEDISQSDLSDIWMEVNQDMREIQSGETAGKPGRTASGPATSRKSELPKIIGKKSCSTTSKEIKDLEEGHDTHHRKSPIEIRTIDKDKVPKKHTPHKVDELNHK